MYFLTLGVKFFIAGSVSNSYGYTDGYDYNAMFAGPGRIAVDTSGTLYVADNSNHYVRKITSAGFVSSLAYVTFANGVVVDSLGGIYATSNYAAVYKITASGYFTRLVYR